MNMQTGTSPMFPTKLKLQCFLVKPGQIFQLDFPWVEQTADIFDGIVRQHRYIRFLDTDGRKTGRNPYGGGKLPELLRHLFPQLPWSSDR